MDLKVGDVIQLPVGLKAYHNQGQELTEIKVPTTAVIEVTRTVAPVVTTGTDAHFEECFIVKARALHEDGTYHPEGALLTFATRGDFRSEFILALENQTVLRRMRKTFLA